MYLKPKIGVVVIVVSAVVGGLFGLTVVSDFPIWLNGLTGIGVGVVVSSLFILFEAYLVPRHLDKRFSTWPFAAVLGLRTSYYTATSVLALWFVPSMFAGEYVSILRAGLVRELLFTVGVAAAFNLIVEFSRLIGPRTLLNIVSGRYHRPQIEDRAVLFLDLVGSTRLAEEVGPTRFHSILNAVFVHLGAVLGEHKGEIYRYVGDEIIATWPVRGDESLSVALAAATKCLAALETEGPRFERSFGMTPRVRASLHVGPLLTGELGGFKKEIAFLGDVMNTTARLQEACRDQGKALVVSKAVLDRAEIPPGWYAETLGPVPLRGRSEPVSLTALSRR